MESEIQNFCYVDDHTTPFVFLGTCFLQGVGIFCFWPVCAYFLFPGRVKRLLACLFAFTALYGVVNTFFFPGKYGPLTRQLEFMGGESFIGSPLQTAANALAACAIMAGCLYALAVRRQLIVSALAILSVSLAGITARNSWMIQAQFRNMAAPESKEAIEPVFHLSRTGRNVIVFMQDRCLSTIMDDIFEERPSLARSFDGFVFYPNAVSLSDKTMRGVPGIFGGYDYTPYEINRRTDETLQKKYNEALLSLPAAFLNAGFAVTVADLPYENFLRAPITDMYRDFPGINRVTTHGTYSDYWYEHHGMKKNATNSIMIMHNMIMFSIFKIVPPVLRRAVEAEDWWNSIDDTKTMTDFIDNYSELEYLPQLFDVRAEGDTYFSIDNEATHEPVFLQAPDYVPVDTVTDRGASRWADKAHYHAQAAAMRCYAAFFDYLREQGVYDNTRIIIVSDHGTGFGTGFCKGTPPLNPEGVTATLLVKDFGAHTGGAGPSALDKDFTFMTNADVPALATDGLIAGARNPFTGSPFKVVDKEPYVKILTGRGESTRNWEHTQFLSTADDWFTVRTDITDGANWSRFRE